jgi:predicted cation transporter
MSHSVEVVVLVSYKSDFFLAFCIADVKNVWIVISMLLIDTYIHHVRVQSSDTKNIKLMQILNYFCCLIFYYNPLVLASGSDCLMKNLNKSMVFSLLAV